METSHLPGTAAHAVPAEAQTQPDGEGPVLVLVPCLSGAPWTREQRHAFHPYGTVTFRLNETHPDIEAHVEDLLAVVDGLGDFVLIGDSFGAQVALACAIRRPRFLQGLVMSGGFASNPVDDWLVKLKALSAGLLPGLLYRHLVVPMHASLLASPYDQSGENGWSHKDSIALFLNNTTWNGYVHRTRASLSANYVAALHEVSVPTLLVTPEDDRLIGRDAANVMLKAIPGAEEIVIPRTGHMFRYSHPNLYASMIMTFLDQTFAARLPSNGQSVIGRN